MKRLVLAMSLAGMVSAAMAQSTDIELRRSDMSYPGQSFAFKTDTSVTFGNDLQAPGKNQRWDFSNLDDNGSFTTKFLAPDANNGGDQVDSCNLVIQEDDQEEDYTYAYVTDDFVRGLTPASDTIDGSPVFNPRILLFPLTYGMSWTDSTRSDQTYPGSEFGVPLDSVRVKLFLQSTSQVDGQGTLILPIDSVEALRIRNEFYFEVEVSGWTQVTGWFPLSSQQDGEISYGFYSKDGGYHAANVTMKTDQPNTAEIDYRSNSILNVKSPANMETTLLYPNPAHATVQFEAEKEGTFQIFTLQGQSAGSATPVVVGTNQLDIQHLAPGQYLIRIQYQDGTRSSSKLVKY